MTDFYSAHTSSVQDCSRLPIVETETKIKDGHTNFILLENTQKVTEIQIDLTNKVKFTNNKEE